MAASVSPFRKLIKLFWSESIWLPENMTWDSLESTSPGVYYPSFEGLYLTVLLGVAFVVFRALYERWIVRPFALCLGIRDNRKTAEPNTILERFYLAHGLKYDKHSLLAVTKQTDWEERKVERWMRVRHSQNKTTDINKFNDCAFHWLVYVVASIYGFIVLYDKPWVYKTAECWMGWPNFHMTNDVYWYYQCELGLYWCLVFRVMSDHRRKDFTENIVHHITTMVLISFSYTVNFVRVGTLVMIIHDVVDPWLAMAKMAKYAKKETLCTGLFVIFAIIWIITRIIIYPYMVIYSTTVEFPRIFWSPACYMFVGLLYMLLLLHIMWTYTILKIAYQSVCSGATDDVRSDSDEVSSDHCLDNQPKEEVQMRIN